jgi:hypothetical protein
MISRAPADDPAPVKSWTATRYSHLLRPEIRDVGDPQPVRRCREERAVGEALADRTPGTRTGVRRAAGNQARVAGC